MRDVQNLSLVCIDAIESSETRSQNEAIQGSCWSRELDVCVCLGDACVEKHVG